MRIPAPDLDVAPRVADALAGSTPVVALETTVISHGLPEPRNLETAHAMIAAVEDEGAVAAPIGVLDGRIRVGLDDEALVRFAGDRSVAKASARDLPALVALGRSGATTVAATVACADAAGIAVFATGGLGGVHRGAAETFDISADLVEIARTPIAIVCSGPKVILDVAKTVEALETAGVPIIGLGVDDVPGFYVRATGHAVAARVDSPEDAAAIAVASRRLGRGGVVFANPVPESRALAIDEVEGWIARGLARAAENGVRGKAITPLLLERLGEESGGRTLDANAALLVDNARQAAKIAVAMGAAGKGRTGRT